MPLTRNFQLAYPDVGIPDRFTTATFSSNCVGDAGIAGAATAASATWPTANTGLFFPFPIVGQDGLDDGRTYVGAIWMNGATASGNLDIGIYDATGIRLASIGTTAQVGTTVPQKASFTTPVQVGPGRFFLGVSMDNTTGTFVRMAPTLAALRGAGVRSRPTSFVLPTTVATWVGTISAYVPWVALVENSWL